MQRNNDTRTALSNVTTCRLTNHEHPSDECSLFLQRAILLATAHFAEPLCGTFQTLTASFTVRSVQSLREH